MDGGRFFYMKIYFQSEAECAYFKHLLSRHQLCYTETKHKRKGHGLYIAHIPPDVFASGIVNVYLVFRLNNNIKDIARNVYYYTNETEVERITEWAYFLLQDKTFIQDMFHKPTLYGYLYELLFNQFRQMQITTEIYYDMFILFPFKRFHEQLVDIVGFAIDELKREEEFQHYVHTVREFIRCQRPKRTTLHVLQRNPFQLYDHAGNKVSAKELKDVVKKEPLYLIGLDETEKNLAPIIAFMPKRIYIYGDDVHEPKTVMLLNIFQERAKLLPEQAFPFRKY